MVRWPTRTYDTLGRPSRTTETLVDVPPTSTTTPSASWRWCSAPATEAAGPEKSENIGWLAKVGRTVETVLAHVGELAMIVWTAIRSVLTGQIGVRQVLREMHWMGVQSLPIITVTGLLSGIVTSQQGGYQFTGSVPLYVLGSVVAPKIRGATMQLHPVLLIFFTLAFALAFGLMGAIVATPAAAFASAYYSEFYLKRPRRRDEH